MNIEVKNSQKPVDYLESMKILEKRVDDVFLGKSRELLWVLEHNTICTAGTSSIESDVLDKNTKIIKTNRGGKHTIHSPGQKIVYFVLNLNRRKKDIRFLINQIEQCIINTLLEYKIDSFPDRDNIGIWIKENNKPKKIAAIGIKVKKWIAYHGFALNITNDLSLYEKIIPCGIKDKEVTNLKELGIRDFDKIEKIITEKFLDIFF